MKISNKCKITTVIGRKVQSAVIVDSRVTRSNMDGKALKMKSRGRKIQFLQHTDLLFTGEG